MKQCAMTLLPHTPANRLLAEKQLQAGSVSTSGGEIIPGHSVRQ
jgi:hypothetical protein